MTRSTGKRKFHFKNRVPSDPAIRRFGDWLPANRGFYDRFRRWLREASYSDSALNIYGCGARLALGWLDKPHWEIDPDADLDRVREYITGRYTSKATRDSYLKGIAKLAEYVRYVCGHPAPKRRINWETYVGPLPDWLAEDVRTYVAHRQRGWVPDMRHKSTIDLLSALTRFLRWAAVPAHLGSISDVTPNLWFEYTDSRLGEGISAVTVNSELRALQGFLRFLAEAGQPVCQRMLRVEVLKQDRRVPRDLPIEQLRLLLGEIGAETHVAHDGVRRMGVMDRAWVLLMLHSGLRVGEVRRLRQPDLELEARRVRIERSKGLKDRIVWLSQETIEALDSYLEVRGPAATDHVFIFRHGPLSVSYCSQRLRTYGRRCGIRVTCHQLRHSCATLLLNAGAPILTVQTILGHKHVDTTLEYARLYDGTVAADYYRAMAGVETTMRLQDVEAGALPGSGQLLALVDSLFGGTLNDAQREAVQALRSGILAMRENKG